jgi:hypothetical protein
MRSETCRIDIRTKQLHFCYWRKTSGCPARAAVFQPFMDITCLQLEADLLLRYLYPRLTITPPLPSPPFPRHRLANEVTGHHRDTHVVAEVRGSSAASAGISIQCACACSSVQSLVSFARRVVRYSFDMRVERTPVASELWQLCKASCDWNTNNLRVPRGVWKATGVVNRDKVVKETVMLHWW